MPEDICLLNETLVCKICQTDFHQELPKEDLYSIKYFTNSDRQGLLTKYALCKEEHIRTRMHKLDTTHTNSWFCNLKYFYVYKAALDIEWNPNYNLQIQVRHYTESTRNAGYAYDLNQSRIFSLAKIQLGESNQDIAKALELQMNDQSNYSYSDEDISLIMRALILLSQKQNKKSWIESFKNLLTRPILNLIIIKYQKTSKEILITQSLFVQVALCLSKRLNQNNIRIIAKNAIKN